MSQESLDDTIKFRAGPLKAAANELDSVHLGGINISKLGREGLTEMLRRAMTDDDKLAIYERYSAGDISEDAARVLLGDEFDLLQEDTEAFREATEGDTSDYLVSMAGGDTRYPILVDTDTLIAVANSSLWAHITDNVGLTTTNVCKQELERHAEETHETAPEGAVRTDSTRKPCCTCGA